MYLKTIEIQGFKSFANKVVFQFHDGITAIVGPNGSGKSNVADAVRWVLGEQSAKSLRGSNMQDVIFAGTETRKPLSFASVSITLDNSDHFIDLPYEEITVARRVYRSGEGEYLLNGAQVRLKDIQELFYDTGIGKEGYSIIGQGQIDKILSSKPEDRRELFDEAAGIVKFKRRKTTTMKKLDEERQNLDRINDILSEISRQLGPLKSQAETAKIYLQKKDLLKTYDANLFLLETSKIQKDEESISDKLHITNEQLQETQKVYDSTKVKYEEAEQKIEQLDSKINEERDHISQNKLQEQQYENQIQLLQEQIRNAKTTDENLSSRITEISDQLENYAKQDKKISDDLKAQNEQLENVRKEYDVQTLNAKKLKEERISIEDDIEEKKSSIIDLLNARSNLKAQIQRNETMSEQAQNRRSQLESEQLKLKNEQESQKTDLDSEKAEYDAITEQIASINSEAEKANTNLTSIQEKLSLSNRQMEETHTTYDRLSSRLESLKNIAERYDGYGNSIRRIMERKDRDKGILGVVADLIDVDKEYENAIETALGSSIQNIVTDTEETAKKQIEYLKKNKYGRATFLPLDGISSQRKFSYPEALKEPGVKGLASDLIRAEKKYSVMLQSLLGRTVIVDSIDHAISLANKYKHELRIVTLDGELFNPGGSISGGAYKNSSNLLGRRREIDELESEIDKIQKSMDEMNANINQLYKERDQLRENLVRLNEQLQKKSLAQNTAALHLEELKEKSTNSSDSYQNLLKEDQKIEQQLLEIKENLKKENESLTQSEREEKLTEYKINQQREKLDQKRQEEEEASSKSQETQLTLSKLTQQGQFLHQDLERILKEKESLTEERSRYEKVLNTTADNTKEKESQINDISEKLHAAEETEKNLQKEIEGLTQEREKISSSNKQFFSEREALSEQISLLDKESFRLNAQLEKLEEQKDNRINYIWDEYGLTFSSAEDLRDSSFTAVTPLRKNITAVKGEIKSLGDVNVNAIEQYKELSERYDFLTNQQDDLKKAEANLNKIIADLDDGMRSQFQTQFAMIQKEFDKTFRQLFGGGHGRLELVEGEDILDAGIQIIAQPPGKKLQNMMQLSGGEKSLTAIALLFAIQKLKPSPFCLLDEIEAALDESNVERFAAYLRRLTKNTQFIIITHRRGAMNVADRLYGITMQEKGISALVSVNMIESELDE